MESPFLTEPPFRNCSLNWKFMALNLSHTKKLQNKKTKQKINVMKTLYISRINSGQPELSELKVRSVLNRHVFFQFQLLFCCILFLFSSTAVIGQAVNTNKPTYFPGESVVISGSVWQPNEHVRLVIENVNFPLQTDTIISVADQYG